MELKEKLINNYSVSIADVIEELTTIGIVKTEVNDFLKYDIYSGTFKPITLEQIKEYIINLLPNYWNVEEVDLNNMIKKHLLEILPTLSNDTLANYYTYLEASSKVQTDKELKEELKELLAINKKRHKKVMKAGRLAPELNVQALINEDVFFNVKTGYVKYNKESDSFIQLGAVQLLQLLSKHFKYQGREIDPYDVQGYMKEYYPNYITSDKGLAYRYNINNSLKQQLEDFKTDYVTVKEILDNFR